jgi:type VI secretion system Hcp family effector
LSSRRRPEVRVGKRRGWRRAAPFAGLFTRDGETAMALDAFMVFNPTQSNKQTKTPIKIFGESSDFLGLDTSGKKQGTFEINDFKWGVSSVKRESKKEKKEKGKDGGDTAEESSSHRVIRVPSFKITKPFDAASPGLFSACLDVACVFTQAIVMFRKTAAGGPFVYLKFVFGNVQVDSVDWGIKPIEQSDAKPDQEDVAFSFETCDIFYSPQTETGTKELAWSGNQKKSASFARTNDMESDE